MKKIRLFTLLLICGVLLVTGCSKSSDTVVIYSCMEDNRIQELKRMLKEEFTDIDVKVQSISTGNTTIEKVIVLPIDCEGYLHSYFSNKRIRGEWFKLNNEDIKFIEKIHKNK